MKNKVINGHAYNYLLDFQKNNKITPGNHKKEKFANNLLQLQHNIEINYPRVYGNNHTEYRKKKLKTLNERKRK